MNTEQHCYKALYSPPYIGNILYYTVAGVVFGSFLDEDISDVGMNNRCRIEIACDVSSATRRRCDNSDDDVLIMKKKCCCF